MFIVLYDSENGEVINVMNTGGAEPSLSMTRNNLPEIRFDGTTVSGVHVPFLILEEDPGLEKGDTITKELVGMDKAKDYYEKKPGEYEKELEFLKARLRTLDSTIDFLLGL